MIGAFSMSLAIVLGAFGAHGLKSIVSVYFIDIFNKAVYYQVIHSFGILIGALILKDSRSLKVLRNLFLAGMVLFSGSLYVLTFSDSLPALVKQIVGPVTPIGGVFFVLAWVYLANVARKEMNNSARGEQ
ncbi:MAG: hypothetical protein RL664_1629 [Bacteroidota bacterium]